VTIGLAPAPDRETTGTSAPHEARARRATDALLLFGTLALLTIIANVAEPPAGPDRTVTETFRSWPKAWTGVWALLAALPVLWSVLVVIGTVARRRWRLLADLALAAFAGAALAAVVSRLATGSWPSVGLLPPSYTVTGWSPQQQLVLAGAVIMTAAPHLARPWRWSGRWLLGIGAIGLVLSGTTSATAALAALLSAAAGAAAVHLALGTSRGWPRLDEVAGSLAALGVEARDLRVATRQPAGVFVVQARDQHDQPLEIKYYGRDAHDTRLVTSLWRSLWYRGAGRPSAVGRLTQVQAEALLTLLAARAGVVTPDVVAAAVTHRGDAVLALRPTGPSLASAPAAWSPHLASSAWHALARLHAAGVTHGQLDAERLAPADGSVALGDFRGARLDTSPELRLVDRAQLLVTTVLALGPESAVEAARSELGPEGLAEVLPYLQTPALAPTHRVALRAADLDLDELRDTAARQLGIEAPALRQLRRVSVGTLIQSGLLLFAFYALASAVAGLDLDALTRELAEAVWPLLALGLVVGQLPRLAQALSTLGASPIPLPLGPVYALQLAMSYLSLAMPSTAARVAVSIRFFQRHGLSATSAVTIGALDGLAGFAVQLVLFTILVLAGPLAVDLALELDLPENLGRWIVLGVGTVVVVGVGVLLAGPWRDAVRSRVTRTFGEVRDALRGVTRPRRFALLIGGNAGAELLFATTLMIFVLAFGHDVGLLEVLLINMIVSLFAGLLPIPGGIGVSEAGLIFGLTLTGMDEGGAFAAVIAHRFATFYLPPLWGWFSLRWLERNEHL
jgi:glycosyltransferase 2 family protein